MAMRGLWHKKFKNLCFNQFPFDLHIIEKEDEKIDIYNALNYEISPDMENKEGEIGANYCWRLPRRCQLHRSQSSTSIRKHQAECIKEIRREYQ